MLDALIHLRRALTIAQTAHFPATQQADVTQLALERCIEIADEALQREGTFSAGEIDEALALNLSRLRYLISRDYHLVDPEVLRNTVLQVSPEIIRKIEPLEDELYRIAKLKRPPASP